MKRLIFIVPIVLFAVLAYFLFSSLLSGPPQLLPSMRIDKPAPTVPLPPLDAQAKGFSPADLKDGHVTVINFFASWCAPCRVEAPVLPLVAQIKGIQFYGVVYKDLPDKSRQFLDELGDPFSRIDIDESGRAGIEWGITGVPETFVIDGKGVVRMHYAGPLTPEFIKNQLMPVIERAQATS